MVLDFAIEVKTRIFNIFALSYLLADSSFSLAHFVFAVQVQQIEYILPSICTSSRPSRMSAPNIIRKYKW